MDFMQRLYASAARVPGMLVEVVIAEPGGRELPPMMLSFDESTEVIMNGEVLGGMPAIKLPFVSLPGLSTLHQVRIGERRFAIKYLQRLSGGSEWQIALKETK